MRLSSVTQSPDESFVGKLAGFVVVAGIIWRLNDPLVARFGSLGAIAVSGAIGAVVVPLVSAIWNAVAGETASER